MRRLRFNLHLLKHAGAGAQLVVFMLLLSRVVGWWAAIAALVTTVSVMPVTAWFGGRQSTSRARLIGLTDARVKLCSEAVSGASRYVSRVASI